jgi:hypothetical protein
LGSLNLSASGELRNVITGILQSIAQEAGRYFLGIDAYGLIASDGDRRSRKFNL